MMPLYVQSFIRYWKDSKSRDLPYHSFSKMQLIYLVTRTWKIFWSTLLLELVLKNRDSMNLYSYSFWSSLIGENWKQFHEESARSPRSVFRSLRSSREKGETRSRRTNGNGKRRRFHGVVSVIVTSAFQGNESRSTEVTVPLIERPAPPGSRPFPNNLVPIPSPLLLSLSSRAHSTPLTIVQSLSLSFSSRILFRNREERLKAGLMNYRFFSGR